MKRRSFFLKLFLGNLLLVAVIMLVSFGLAYVRINREFRNRQQLRQEQTTEIVKKFFEDFWAHSGEQLKRQRIDSLCKQLMSGRDMRLTVIADDGQVLGDSHNDPYGMENHRDRPEVSAALDGRNGRDVRPSDTMEIQFRYFGLPVEYEGETVAVARLAMPLYQIDAAREFIPEALAVSAMTAVGAALILGLLISWLWYRPLRLITFAARRIARGDLEHRLSIRGSDELNQLSEAINQMRTSLSQQIQTVASQRKNLAAVVANLQEGILAIDGEGKVVLANDSARRILDIVEEDPVGKHLQNVVRQARIIDTVEKLRHRDIVNDRVQMRTEAGPVIIDLHAARITSTEDTGVYGILVLRDVTDLSRMAEMKSQFVANASHELRTPLATIRAAVDSLTSMQDEVPESASRVVSILDRHVSRLEDMANDLLDLNVVETSGQQLHPEKITLGGLRDWAKDRFAEIAAGRKIELRIESKKPDYAFRSDLTLIKLILQNLLDNAIKFTPAGGNVEGRLDTDGELVKIQVSDTGCGIPPEMNERVFERFFQMETSRTGDTRVRGTGLGLAIVKHAAERLGGKISLQSKPGQGTTITVSIPPQVA